eukprot:g15013.t1
MSAFNAFFAQLTGGGNAAGGAPSNTAGSSSQDRRGSATADGGGGGGGGGGGSGGAGVVGEVFGVPLTGAAVTYDPENDKSRFGTPQCETVTTLPESSRRRGLCDQGALVVANADFVCYGIKSNIRVIHRPSGARALIKLPAGSGSAKAKATPQDMSLLETTASANEVSGLLACATSDGDLMAWELLARLPGGGDALSAETVISTSDSPVLSIERGGAQSVAWHPSGVRFLAVVCGSSVVICDFRTFPGSTNSLSPPAIGERPTIAGATCEGHYKQVTDASFSLSGDVLATAAEDGTVRVWDTGDEAILLADPFPGSIACLRAFRAAPEGSTLSRVLVVDGATALVTGDEENRLLKVWPSSGATPGAGGGAEVGALEGLLPLQVLSLPGRGALSLEADPEGKFVFAADTGEGLLYALHLAEGGQKGMRMDYLRPYSLAHPVQSFTVLSKDPEPQYGYEDSTPAPEDRILQLVCVQTKPVQIYRITAGDALPPSGLLLDNDLDSSTVIVVDDGGDGGGGGGGDGVSAAAASGDLPTALSPVELGAFAAEAGEEVEAEKVQDDDDVDGGGDNDDSAVEVEDAVVADEGEGARVVVGVAGGDVDSVALSKEGDAGGAGAGVGGESAPSFEKKLDITDEPLGLMGMPATTSNGDSTTPSATVGRAPDDDDDDDDDDDHDHDDDHAGNTVTAPPGGEGPSAGSPTASGVMVGDGAAGGGSAAAAAANSIHEPEADLESSGAGPGGEATAAEDGWEGASKQDWGQEGPGGGSGAEEAAAAVERRAPEAVMADSLSDSSSHGRREADTSAGASPIPAAARYHVAVAGSPSGETPSSGAAAAAAPREAAAAAVQLEQALLPPPPPPPPPPAPTVDAMVADVSSSGNTAGGEASRDVGAASATLALRSLLMGGGAGGAGGGGADGEPSRFWSSGGSAAEGGAGAVRSAAALPRADAEGAGAGLARPLATAPGSASAAAAAAAALPLPASSLATSSTSVAPAPAVPISSASASAPAAQAVEAGPIIGGGGRAGTTAPKISSSPPVSAGVVPESHPLPPGNSFSDGDAAAAAAAAAAARSAGLLSAPAPAPAADDVSAGLLSGSSLAEVVRATNGGGAQAASGSGAVTAPRASAAPAAEQQPRGAGALDSSGVGGMSAEELVEAVTARVSAEMAERMSGLQASLEQSVVSCCRQTLLASMANTEGARANERAALVGDISSSVDRSVRRGMAETVATPLAKLVVNTAHKVVVDPLQTSMSTLHGQQQRQQQALAAAAAAGVQAGLQSQAGTIATATARAQAGNVRREMLESREELSRDVSRAVAAAVQEPVGAAFRECFEGQLIPRIQGAVQRMFEQINETLNRGLQASPLVNNRAGALADDVSQVRNRVEGLESGMRDVMAALSGLGSKMERLAELSLATQKAGLATAASVEAVAASARSAAAAAAAGGGGGGGTAASRSIGGRGSPPVVAVNPREELHRLVSAGRIDEAMNRALSASDLPLVMWLCGHLNPVETPPTLPQHILLCLVQQFGASDLLEDTTAKLKWLQSCVLAIDPAEATIRAHLPVVLHQLKSALTTSTPIISQRGGPDVSVVRLTTHVVNSLASMLPPGGSEGL